MKKKIILIVLLLTVFTYAAVDLSSNIAPMNLGFQVLMPLEFLGTTGNDVSADEDDNDCLDLEFGGTDSNLSDPAADRIVFWDTSVMNWLIPNTGLSITGTNLNVGGLTASELATDSVSADELNAAGVEAELEAVLDLQDLQGAVTDGQVPDNITIDLATTVTVSDDESTDDDHEVVFTTDNANLESDGDFHYSPDTGTATVPALTLTGDTSVISSAHEIDVKPNGATDDYLQFLIDDSIYPAIKVQDGEYVRILSANDNVGLTLYDAGASYTRLYHDKDNDDFYINVTGGFMEVDVDSYLNFKVSGDETDYIQFITSSNVPEVNTVGACDLKINSSSGEITSASNWTMTGTLDAGATTLTGNLIIPNAGSIGSASDTDAMQIETDGDVVLTQNIRVKNDKYVYIGDTNDVGIWYHTDYLNIKNYTHGGDIYFRWETDGGVEHHFQIDGTNDKIKSGTGTFDFDDDDIVTTGTLDVGETTITGDASVSGNLGVGTSARSDTAAKIALSDSTVYIGLDSSLTHTGSQQYIYGTNCTAIQDGSHGSPWAYGGIFKARLGGSGTRTATGGSRMYGGMFMAQDKSGITYDVSGGSYQMYAACFSVNNASGDWTTNNPSITTYAVYIDDVPTGYGSSLSYYSLYSLGGPHLLRYNTSGATLPVLEVRQDNTGGAVPCLELDQDDTDVEFVDFVGTDGSTTGSDSGSSVIVALNGTQYKLKLYNMSP